MATKSNRNPWSNELRRLYLRYEYFWKFLIGSILIAIGIVLMFLVHWFPGLTLCGFGVRVILSANRSSRFKKIKQDPFEPKVE